MKEEGRKKVNTLDSLNPLASAFGWERRLLTTGVTVLFPVFNIGFIQVRFESWITLTIFKSSWSRRIRRHDWIERLLKRRERPEPQRKLGRSETRWTCLWTRPWWYGGMAGEVHRVEGGLERFLLAELVVQQGEILWAACTHKGPAWLKTIGKRRGFMESGRRGGNPGYQHTSTAREQGDKAGNRGINRGINRRSPLLFPPSSLPVSPFIL